MVLIATLVITSSANSDSLYVIDWSNRLSVGYNPFYYEYLHFDMFSGRGFWQTRCVDPKSPGDYFSEPSADSSYFDTIVATDLMNNYKNLINLEIPMDLIKHTRWFSDTLHGSDRTEYFLRYTDSHCVYVISGWWPKFIKYFKAIPRDLKLTQNELKTELKTILNNSKLIDSMKFRENSEENLYLLESTFSNVSVRNYKFVAKWYEGRSRAPDLGQPPPMFSDWYNIIEITIYLDKEFMP
jgi:hypothetical protein